MESGYILDVLKVEPTGYSDGLEVAQEKKRGVKKGKRRRMGEGRKRPR